MGDRGAEIPGRAALALSLPRVLYIPDPTGRVPLMRRLSAALRGDFEGDVAILLRIPERPARDLLALAAMARPLARAAGARLLFSGRCDLALVGELDGVHLPARGISVADARTLLGEVALIGRSCHDAAELAWAEGADYVTLSPVANVPGKAPALGLDRFEALARRAPCPVLALGGIDMPLAEALGRRGAHGVAVRRAIDAAEDPAAELRRFLRALPPRVAG